MFSRLSLIWAIVLFFIYGNVNGESLYQNEESFHAEYLNRTVNALHANGSDSATILHQPTANFATNPITSQDEGLVIGNGNASLSYSCKDNLPNTVGSIEIRFKPIDWRPNQDTYNILFQTATGGATPPAKLLIYKCKQNGIAVYLRYNDNQPAIFLHKSISNWCNNIYHHLVVSYDCAGDVVLFVDGTEVGRANLGSTSNPAVINWPTNFTMGPYSTGFGYSDGQAAIERLRIYHTALNAEQVKYLAEKKEFNQLLGKFSHWFTNGCPQLDLIALDKDTVPPPWTPISFSTATSQANCWNREYNFSGSNIMKNVQSGTQELLAGAITLDISVGDESGAITFGTPTIDEQGDGRIIFTRTGGLGSTSATVKYTFEYDGLVWIDLTLDIPDSAQINSLQLNIPFAKYSARFMHYVGAPATYTSQNLPENSYSKAIPYSQGIYLQTGLKSMVWIGNNHYGMLWCMESDQYWWPKNRNDCIKIERLTDGRVNLTVNMVAQTLPTNAPKTIKYSFGLLATPTKPMPTGWRSWTHTDQASGRTGDLRGINVIYWPSEYRFMLLDHDPTRYLNITATQDKIIADNTNPERRYILPYWTRTNIYNEHSESDPNNPQITVTKVHPEASLMTRDWGTIPHGTTTYRLSAATHWSDYLVWSLDEFRNVMGHIDGFYLDEVQPIPNKRSESNGGYDDLNGTRRPTFEMFGTRNLIKRMTYNVWQHNLERPRALVHCSGTEVANSIDGVDLWLIGEQYNSGYFWNHPELKPPPDDEGEKVYYYSYALPMDRLRTEGFYKQWGEVIVWLPQLKNQPDIMDNPISTRDMLSRVMQADVVIWPLWCNRDEVYKTWSFRKDYGIGDTSVEFHPYWEQGAIIASPIKLDAWWTFNDGGNTLAKDKTVHEHDATLINMDSALCWVDGIAGKALRFSDNGGYVDTGSNLHCDSMNSYTIEFWLKPESSGIAGRHIVETWTGGNSGFAIQLAGNDKLCSYQSVNGSIYTIANYVPFPHDGEFHHVAVSFNYDGTNCTLKTYIDGELKASKTVAGTPDLALPGRSMYIGHGTYSGLIDDFKIFPRSLNDTEVFSEFNKIKLAVNLKFDDAQGTIATDSSSHNINGTLTGMNTATCWSNNDGRRSIRFNNNGGYVDCGVNPLFTVNNYTIEFWLKPESSGIAGRHIVETWTGSNSGFAIQLAGNDKLCSYQSVNGSIYTIANYVPFPHDREFHHVAVSFNYDGTNCTLKTYIDGELKASKTVAGTPDLALPGRSMYIGHGTFDGNMSDFKFYTRSLGDNEIALAAEQYSSTPNIVTGFYSNSAEKYLAIVSNIGRTTQEIKVDLRGMTVTSLKDAETGDIIPVNSNKVAVFTLSRNDYRALRINY